MMQARSQRRMSEKAMMMREEGKEDAEGEEGKEDAEGKEGEGEAPEEEEEKGRT